MGMHKLSKVPDIPRIQILTFTQGLGNVKGVTCATHAGMLAQEWLAPIQVSPSAQYWASWLPQLPDHLPRLLDQLPWLPDALRVQACLEIWARLADPAGRPARQTLTRVSVTWLCDSIIRISLRSYHSLPTACVPHMSTSTQR